MGNKTYFLPQTIQMPKWPIEMLPLPYQDILPVDARYKDMMDAIIMASMGIPGEFLERRMTEAEWLASTDPQAMLQWLTRRADMTYDMGPAYRATNRKLRLFACACCRQPEVWDGKVCPMCGHLDPTPFLEQFGRRPLCVTCGGRGDDGKARAGTGRVGGLDPRSRNAVEVAERFADGEATLHELTEATWHKVHYVTARFADWSATGAGAHSDVEATAQAALLRDIFGNPFRTVRTCRDAERCYYANACQHPEDCSANAETWRRWKNGTVVKLAQAIYDDRSFHLMPILGDALEEAGCADAAILAHCRDGGVHVRGCWVVDLLLGKE